MGCLDAHGKACPPFAWEEAHRLTLRAKQFILYGIFGPARGASRREDIRYIYSILPIVAEKEVEKWGS